MAGAAGSAPTLKACIIWRGALHGLCTALRCLPLALQVELPLGATEDRICGTIDIEKALQEGIKAYEPGLLVSAAVGCTTCLIHVLICGGTAWAPTAGIMPLEQSCSRFPLQIRFHAIQESWHLSKSARQ